jgi:hypothetical protein
MGLAFRAGPDAGHRGEHFGFRNFVRPAGPAGEIAG